MLQTADVCAVHFGGYLCRNFPQPTTRLLKLLIFFVTLETSYFCAGAFPKNCAFCAVYFSSGCLWGPAPLRPAVATTVDSCEQAFVAWDTGHRRYGQGQGHRGPVIS